MPRVPGSFHPGQVSYKRVESLSDLSRFGRKLWIRCGACGHDVTWTLRFAMRQFGGTGSEDWTFAAIGRRLRCSECKAKRAQLGSAD